MTRDQLLQRIIDSNASAACHIAHTINIDKYLTTDVGTILYIDGSRIDTYEPNGSITKPFKDVNTAFAAGELSTSPALTFIFAPGNYAETPGSVLPNKKITLFGNGANVTFRGGITIPNANYTRYDLNTSGNLIFSGVTPGKAIIQGGSVDGDITIGNDTESPAVFVDAKSCSFLGNTHTINVCSGSKFAAIVCTFTERIIGKGIIAIEDNMIDTSYAGYLITSEAGGVITGSNNIIVNSSNNAAAGGISCDNGATGFVTTSNPTGNNRQNGLTNCVVYVPYGTGIATGTSKTVRANNWIFGGIAQTTGIGFMPINDMIIPAATMELGSDATGDIYYRDSSALLTRVPIGTVGQVLKSNGTIPYWAAP